MSGSTVTKEVLANAVCSNVGLSRSESTRIIELLFESIAESLERGDKVKIAGVGSFSLSDKSARMGRNPKSGEPVEITPRRVLVFHASQILKQQVVDGCAADDSDASE